MSRSFDYTGRPESARATIQMTHSASGPTVSLEEAKRIEKETAEHRMLVDLGRNDIGRISETASVQVTKYMEVELFRYVMKLS